MNGDSRLLDGVSPLHLVVVLEPGLSARALDLLLTRCSLLKRRFAPTLTGVAGGLSVLAASGLQHVLAQGVFGALYFSGDFGFTTADAVTAARRAGKANNLFLPANALLQDFALCLRLMVEIQGQPHEVAWVPALCGLFSHQSRLDSIPAPHADEALSDWQDRVVRQLDGTDAPCHVHGAAWTGEAGALPAASLATRRHELYVTATGLARFGGAQRFRSLPLQFGRVPVRSCGCLHALDNDIREWRDPPADATQELCLLPGSMPGQVEPDKPERYLLDVVPAGGCAGDDGPDEPQCFRLPRQMLQLRAVALEAPTSAMEAAPARMVFATSNFEKGRFVPAGLYAMAMQSHPRVEICLTDDNSSDDSVALARRFSDLMLPQTNPVILRVNPCNRGTYWIRNEIIYSASDAQAIFLINDSDDVSSLQRAWLQDQWIRQDSNASGCFLDIVRVDDCYNPMKMDAEIERYGTASLAIRGALIEEIGFFENIQRNADTEFIERCRVLKGRKALPWHRYPCLFQVFDGKNLTADIYKAEKEGKRIVADHSARSQHTMLFRRRHQNLTFADARRIYSFPESGVGADYKGLGGKFLVAGYEGTDDIVVLTTAAEDVCKRLVLAAATVLQVRGSAVSGEGRQVTTFGVNGKEFRTDLGVGAAMRHLLEIEGFSGYVLICKGGSWLEGLSESGSLLRSLHAIVHQSKRHGDQPLYRLSADGRSSPGGLRVMDFGSEGNVSAGCDAVWVHASRFFDQMSAGADLMSVLDEK